MTPDDRRILRERATALAREPEPDTGGERVEVVEFILARERYAVAAAHVREVLPLKDFTPVPCTPPHIAGMMNVRGQVLAIVDLGRLFDLPASTLSDLGKVVILRAAGAEVGVLADAIASARVLRLAELQPSLPTLTGIRAEFLRGVTADRLIVLDVAKLLGSDALLVREEVES